MTTNCEYQAKQISDKLVNAKIVGAALTEDKECFGIVLKKGSKQFTVWVDCDAEGNGAGWLSID